MQIYEKFASLETSGEANFSIKFGNPFYLVLFENRIGLRLGDNLDLFRTILRAHSGLIVPPMTHPIRPNPFFS